MCIFHEILQNRGDFTMNMRIDETRLNQLLQNIKHDGQQQQVQQTNINMTNKTEGNAKHLNLLDIELYMMNDPYSEKGEIVNKSKEVILIIFKLKNN